MKRKWQKLMKMGLINIGEVETSIGSFWIPVSWNWICLWLLSTYLGHPVHVVLGRKSRCKFQVRIMDQKQKTKHDCVFNYWKVTSGAKIKYRKTIGLHSSTIWLTFWNYQWKIKKHWEWKTTGKLSRYRIKRFTFKISFRV